MSDKQLDLHTHLSKLYICAIPERHTLMRQLFRQQACVSVGGDATKFSAVGLTWFGGPQRRRQTGRYFTHFNEDDFSHFMANNEFYNKFALKNNQLCKGCGMPF